MTARCIDAFFYGLFMDVEILRDNAVTPVNPRPAYIDGFALRIGQHATLLPSPGARAYGMLIALTHPERERLYSGPGLEHYRPEAVLARTLKGEPILRLCVTICAKRLRHMNAIRITRHVFRPSYKNWASHPSMSHQSLEYRVRVRS